MAVTENKRFLNHGAQDLYYASLNPDGTYYTPRRWEGMISGEIEDESEKENFYADDIVYATLPGAKLRKVSLKVAQIPETAMISVCGFEKDDATGFLCDSNLKKRVAVYWCEKIVDVDTNTSFRRMHILYNAILNGKPKFETETNEDKASVSEIELEFNNFAHPTLVDGDGESVDYVVIDESPATQTIFDNMATKVYVPQF